MAARFGTPYPQFAQSTPVSQQVRMMMNQISPTDHFGNPILHPAQNNTLVNENVSPMAVSQIPESITIKDLYVLMMTTKEEIKASVDSIKVDISELKTTIGSLNDRVGGVEARVTALEDNLDDKIRDQESAIKLLLDGQEDYPVDTTIICSGIKQEPREDIYEVSQEFIENGLG